jgi:hypothetical protein
MRFETRDGRIGCVVTAVNRTGRYPSLPQHLSAPVRFKTHCHRTPQ